MRNLFLLLVISLAFAPASFAQDDYSSWEFFIGYAHERANNGADRLDARGLAVSPTGATSRVDFVSERIPYNGVMGEAVANVHRNVGVVANFSATFASYDFVDVLGARTFDARLQRYTLLFGPRFNWRNSTRLIPFGHALFGVSHYRAGFKNDDFTCPDTSESAFAMGFGAGLDIRASDSIDIRPIQVDYIPIYWDRRREDAWRFAAGVKFK